MLTVESLLKEVLIVEKVMKDLKEREVLRKKLINDMKEYMGIIADVICYVDEITQADMSVEFHALDKMVQILES